MEKLLKMEQEIKNKADELANHYTKDINFDNLDLITFVDQVCKEYSGIYERLGKYLFVMLEKYKIENESSSYGRTVVYSQIYQIQV